MVKKALYILLPLTAVIAIGAGQAASLKSTGEQVYYNIQTPKKIFIRKWKLVSVMAFEVVNPGNATIDLQSVFLQFFFKNIKLAEIREQVKDGRIEGGSSKEISLNLLVPIVDTALNLLMNVFTLFSSKDKKARVSGKLVANGFEIPVLESYDLSFKQEENEGTAV